MARIVKALSALALVAGLGIGAIAMTPSAAVAGCRTENTDYTGIEPSFTCLGGTCRVGWCCLICERT